MKKINLFFRQAFEYSVIGISPRKFSPLVFNIYQDYPLEKKDFEKMRSGLVENMVSNTARTKEYLVNSEKLKNLNLKILESIAGRTVLHNAGKELGELIGEKIKEPDFKKYLLEINDLLQKLNVGKIRIRNFEGMALDFVIHDNIFSSGLKENKKLCYFMSGLFQGILEEYTNTRWNVIEKNCIAKGDPYCVFQCRNI